MATGYALPPRPDMVTPMVQEVTGKEPRSFDQFARDFVDAFKVG